MYAQQLTVKSVEVKRHAEAAELLISILSVFRILYTGTNKLSHRMITDVLDRCDLSIHMAATVLE